MIIIISKIIFIASILGILFIIARKIPALSQLSEEFSAGKISFQKTFTWLSDNIKQLVSSKIFQNTIVGNLEKSLRKSKIMALKIDNIADKFIRKIKKNGSM